MKCPHCASEFAAATHMFSLGEDQSGSWEVNSTRCGICDRLIVTVGLRDGTTYPAWPQSSARVRLSSEVPDEYAGDYHSACQTLPHSPEASSALGRRLLQKFLAEQIGATEGGLADQIRVAVLGSELPQFLREALQTYSAVAHLDEPGSKSDYPSALADVQPLEAEWLLDVLEGLFDSFFVRPALLRFKEQEVRRTLLPQPTSIPDPQTED